MMKKADERTRTLDRKKVMRRELALSLIFILPSILVLLYTVFYPIVNSAYLSFFDWNGVSPVKTYVGLENYRYVFNDPKLYISLKNNFIWMVLHIVFSCGYGLILAFLISRVRKAKTIFRVILFLPNVVAASVSGVMWTMMYNTQYGLVIKFLQWLGMDTSEMLMLGDPKAAIYLVAIASCWQAYGYYMTLFLAGLQNIDASLYEAAEMDGAGSLQQFIHVTIPGLNNVFSFVLSIAIINGLRGFSTVWIMTEGGPGDASYLMAVYGYVKAFREQDMGKAMVSGLTIGVIIIVITTIFNTIREKRSDE